jgi:hypothetical protein
MARIPEPQPKSMTVLPVKSKPSNHSKQSAVGLPFGYGIKA